MAVSAWTREEAAVQLHLCSAEKHWITTPTCDSCWINEHRCPPTLADTNRLVREAQELERRALALRAALEGKE